MKTLRTDDGFSLSELLVVLGLLGVVLGIAWAAFGIASSGSSLANRESRTSQEIGASLLEAERLLMQRSSVRQGYVTSAGRNLDPGPYLVAFDTDRDNDNKSELNIIEATTDGQLVIRRLEEGDPAGLTSAAWSRDLYNVDAGVPLLRYYDANGTELINAADRALQSRTVVITIVTEFEGKQYRDSRTVVFRNR